MTFEPGRTVRLKSGGPLMTVQSIDPDGLVNCEWFDEKKTLQTKAFRASSLEADDGSIRV